MPRRYNQGTVPEAEIFVVSVVAGGGDPALSLPTVALKQRRRRRRQRWR